MLVVMEYRDLHARLQALLDLETFRRLDIFQVDAAECGFKPRNALDERIDLLLRDFDVEAIDASEFLEQNCLAFHDRLGGERPNVAEP